MDGGPWKNESVGRTVSLMLLSALNGYGENRLGRSDRRTTSSVRQAPSLQRACRPTKRDHRPFTDGLLPTASRNYQRCMHAEFKRHIIYTASWRNRCRKLHSTRTERRRSARHGGLVGRDSTDHIASIWSVGREGAW